MPFEIFREKLNNINNRKSMPTLFLFLELLLRFTLLVHYIVSCFVSTFYFVHEARRASKFFILQFLVQIVHKSFFCSAVRTG